MRAASRALVVLLAVVATGSPAAAQTAPPACPTAIAELPLSVAVPFSGTPRPVADHNGEITSISLLCAYGEGVEPSAQLAVTWDPNADPACADTETVVAEGIDARAFEAAAATLADPLGGTCAQQNEGQFPLTTAAIAAASLAVIAAIVMTARRRAAHEASGPQRRETPVVPERGLRVEGTAGGRPPPSDETTLDGPPARRPSDPSPILQELRAAETRTTTGQLVAIAAIADHRGNDAAKALALAAARNGGRGAARADLAAIAEALAHQDAGADR